MIFVTVGTHEDGFDRLVREVDRLVGTGAITEEVVYQAGYARFQPAHGGRVEAMIPFDEVQTLMRRARVIVTHGGPASIMQALALGKVPVVVPRRAKFGEHVDDHQVRFAARIADRVEVVLEIADLAAALTAAGDRSGPPPPPGASRADAFGARLDVLCDTLFPAGQRRNGVLRWPR